MESFTQGEVIVKERRDERAHDLVESRHRSVWHALEPAIDASEGDVPCLVEELPDAVRFSRCHDKIVRLVVLEHPPHCLDIIAREAPVALRRQVAEIERVLRPDGDASDGSGDLPRDEILSAPR